MMYKTNMQNDYRSAAAQFGPGPCPIPALAKNAG